MPGIGGRSDVIVRYRSENGSYSMGLCISIDFVNGEGGLICWLWYNQSDILLLL